MYLGNALSILKVAYLLGKQTPFWKSIKLLSRLKSESIPDSNGRGHPSGAANQAQVLRGEGVTVTRGNLGEYLVDLSEYGWFPRQLPSHAAEGLEPFVDSDGEEWEAPGWIHAELARKIVTKM